MGEANVGQVRVTERGQMSLPAQARHRWGLDEGGEVGWVDLGDVLLLVPGGVSGARAALLDQVDADDWAQAAAGFGDPELANQ
jgi:hypothetical protein